MIHQWPLQKYSINSLNNQPMVVHRLFLFNHGHRIHIVEDWVTFNDYAGEKESSIPWEKGKRQFNEG